MTQNLWHNRNFRLLFSSAAATNLGDGLIAVAVPVLIWLTYAKGWLWGLAFLIAAGSVLRWPLIYLMRWIKRRLA